MAKRALWWLSLPIIVIIGFIYYMSVEYPGNLALWQGLTDYNFTPFEAIINGEQFWGEFYINTAIALLFVGVLLHYSPHPSFTTEEDLHTSILRLKKAVIKISIILAVFLILMLIAGILQFGFRNNLSFIQVFIGPWYPSQIYQNLMRIVLFSSGLFWLPLLLQEYHHRQFKIARSGWGLLFILIGLTIVFWALLTQQFEAIYILDGGVDLGQNAYDLVFSLPMAMLTIAYVEKIAPSAGDEKSVKTPERRQAVIRIWKYIFFTGLAFGAYFGVSWGLSYFDITNYGINMPIDAGDILTHTSRLIYGALLVADLYILGRWRLMKALEAPLSQQDHKVIQSILQFWHVFQGKRIGPRKIAVIGIIGLFIGTGIGIGVKIANLPQMVLCYNQCGYLPSENKQVLIQLNTAAVDPKLIQYNVYNQTVNGVLLMSGNPNFMGYQFGSPIYSVDLTDLNVTGNYSWVVHLSIGNRETVSGLIQVSPNCYNLALERAYEFFYYQRSGFNIQSFIPGYSSAPADQLDDGLVMNDSGDWVYRNLTGGWHDAGDYNKYMEWITNTPFIDLALALSYENDPSFFNALPIHYGVSWPDLVDEAVWGADFLAKMTLDDGRVYTNLMEYNHITDQYERFRYGGAPYLETENVPNDPYQFVIGSIYNTTGNPADITTSDWRFIAPDVAIETAAAMLTVANLLAENFPNHPDNVTYQQRIQTYLVKAQDILNRYNQTEMAGSDADSWGDVSLLFADMGLIQATSNGLLNLDQAVIMAQMLQLYSNLLSYMANDGSDDWGSEYAFYGIDRIGAFLEQQTNMTTTIENYFQNVLWPLAQEGGNYFAVTPTGSVDNNEQLFEWGNNAQISATMLIDAVVANLTGNTNALSISMNELNWILGENPFGICQEESVGTNNLPTYSSRFISIPGDTSGAHPGSIPQGLTTPPPTNVYIQRIGNPPDASNYLPQISYLDLRTRSFVDELTGSSESSEMYITNNAAYMLGFSMLMSLVEPNAD